MSAQEQHQDFLMLQAKALQVEMLEMLEIVKSEFGEYHFLYNAIDILIKKATKIL